MRFLGIGDSNDLGALYMRIAAAGHEVRVHVGDPEGRGKLAGLVEQVADWEGQLDWVRAAGRDGIILFETAHDGDIQERLRRDGFNVIGGGAFGDRLENDRAFGQHHMRRAGMQTAPVHEFDDFDAAAAYLRARPGRHVYKPNGAHLDFKESYVGELDDGSDLVAILGRERARWHHAETPSFVLMEHLAGVEVGVGAYFNGERFMDPVCIDWEHKRFFPGDIGEMTGEMGTLVSYRNAGPLFAASLGRMAETLRANGYLGYINLNTIVNQRGIWPLEFTCRFGYPGFAILECLHEEGWETLFARMIAGRETRFATAPGFAVGAVLTMPPFPFAADPRCAGLPITFRGALSDDDRRHLHFDEVKLEGGALVTAGPTGYVMVVTGRGDTVEQAQDAAYGLIRRVVVPNGRWRTDIGDRFVRSERAAMQGWGLWPGETG